MRDGPGRRGHVTRGDLGPLWPAGRHLASRADRRRSGTICQVGRALAYRYAYRKPGLLWTILGGFALLLIQ